MDVKLESELIADEINRETEFIEETEKKVTYVKVNLESN